MSTRRQFLSTLGGSAAALAVSPAAHSSPQLGALSEAGLWVVDARIADPEKATPHKSISIASFEGDVSSVWQADVRPHILSHRTPIAGFTQEDALFCLQQLAADFRWRLQRCVDVAHGNEVSASCLTTRSNSLSWLLIPPSVA